VGRILFTTFVGKNNASATKYFNQLWTLRLQTNDGFQEDVGQTFWLIFGLSYV